MGRNQACPCLIIIDEEPASWKGGGAYFLDWREGGKRVRKLAGKAPREALDAWRRAIGVANGSMFGDWSEAEDGAKKTQGISTEDGIEQFLQAVKATKGNGTRSPNKTCLRCAWRHIMQHLVNRLNRNDLLACINFVLIVDSTNSDRGLRRKVPVNLEGRITVDLEIGTSGSCVAGRERRCGPRKKPLMRTAPDAGWYQSRYSLPRRSWHCCWRSMWCWAGQTARD